MMEQGLLLKRVLRPLEVDIAGSFVPVHPVEVKYFVAPAIQNFKTPKLGMYLARLIN